MGQYHLLVNSDKKEFVNPRMLGMGMKQMEQVGFLGDLPFIQYLLTTASPGRGFGDFTIPDDNRDFIGRWVGDRVFILGDYTEENDVPKVRFAHKFWMAIHAKETEWIDISDRAAKALEILDLDKIYN
jgi:hypothetical protein